ncbi:MAG: hypothetical protein H8E91_06270 [Planctomycetes bacterium]|nr:hypothetical protein [Planctomycetota bacterium]
MNKKIISRCFIGGAILIIACPFVSEYVFHIRPKYILQSIGIRYVLDEHWFFVAGGFIMVAAALQLPFKEEEAWHCACGYDLSYANQKSKQCPECGEETQLEWSAVPGTYSRKTTRRLYWAIFLFFGSLTTFGIGVLVKILES